MIGAEPQTIKGNDDINAISFWFGIFMSIFPIIVESSQMDAAV